MSSFKPMLAGTVEDPAKLTYPLHASVKIDGIRALVINGVLVSRNLKPIPNRHCQALFGWPHLEGLDGELVVGDPTASDVFRNTSSGVMSVEGEPDVVFHVFDFYNRPAEGFTRRHLALSRSASGKVGHGNVLIVPHPLLENAEQVEEFERAALSVGWEGIMLRSPGGLYKHGRGTLKTQDLLKLKRFADDEAEVIGFEEQMHNGNEATKDELGRTKRTTHKAGKTGKGTLGALRVRGLTGPYAGVEFSIGSGLDDAERAAIWNGRSSELLSVLGGRVTFKYFPSGSKDAPRFPVFKGFRAEGA